LAMLGCPTTIEHVASANRKYGAAPNAMKTLAAAKAAAEESVSTGLYVTWLPHPSSTLGPSAAAEIKSGTGQCCRVGSFSICKCGHSLKQHKQTQNPKSSGCIKPPSCLVCRSCSGFNYSPFFPEECGQWWLARRKDFNVEEWRERVRKSPNEYSCVGCEVLVSDHETIFESRRSRADRGAVVDADYFPLHDMPDILSDLRNDSQKRVPRVRNPSRALPATAGPCDGTAPPRSTPHVPVVSDAISATASSPTNQTGKESSNLVIPGMYSNHRVSTGNITTTQSSLRTNVRTSGGMSKYK